MKAHERGWRTLCCIPALALNGPVRALLVDSAAHRLIVAHAHAVTALDSRTGQVLAEARGFNAAHGLAMTPDGRIFAASNKAGQVHVLDGRSMAQIASIAVGADADAAVYDPASRHVFVMNDDDGTVSAIDADSLRVDATIRLPGGEGLKVAAADGAGHVFVVHPAQGDLVRIDTRRAAVDGIFALPGCAQPAGLALNPAGRLAYVTCSNGRLAVVGLTPDQPNAGGVQGGAAIAPHALCVIYDRTGKRLLVAGGRDVQAVALTEAGLPARVSHVADADHARALAVDAATQTLYVGGEAGLATQPLP